MSFSLVKSHFDIGLLKDSNKGSGYFKMEKGKVVLVGAGPGELELITLRGLEYLKQADCVVYDRLLNPAMLDFTKDQCEKIFVGKANHHHTMVQDDINQLLYDKASEGKLVVRLKGGDPYVFGRGGEEALFLRECQVDVELVPGISSAIAALAAAGIPITHRGLSKGFQVITAHSRKDEPADINYSLLVDEDITLLFLMGLSHVSEIARGLISAGRDAHSPVAVVSSGTTNHQKKVIGTLANIAELVEVNHLESPAIIIVGKVVTLADRLSMFEERPLFGKKYFLPTIRNFNYSYDTGIVESNENALEKTLTDYGAEVIRFETGRIMHRKINLDFLHDMKSGDYFVFTSKNGVKSFFWNLREEGLDLRSLCNVKIAAIGAGTADGLLRFGVTADLVPLKQNGAELAALLSNDATGEANVYWLSTTDSSQGFEEGLSDNLHLNKIVCYENISSNNTISPETLKEILDCDGAIFTSGSNAKMALKATGGRLPETIYSIGPACSKAIKSLGFEKVREAEISSYQGILEMILGQ